MRILLINYEFPPLGGGAGNASRFLAEAWAGLGSPTLVLTSRFPGLLAREHQDGVDIVRIPARRRKIHRSDPAEMASFMWSALARVEDLARQWRPDVCVAFFGLPSGPPAFWLKYRLKIPFVISMRGGDVPGFQKYDLGLAHTLSAPLIHFLWKKADGLLANSQGLRRLALDFDPQRQVQVIPNGVDSTLFFPAAGAGLRSRFRVLFVGRIQHQKGGDLLLKALARIADKNWELVVVGDGPDRGAWEGLAHGLGLEEKVCFLGWQDRSCLPGIYRNSDLFVLPSRDEGMPNVLLEAMASGLPLIATRISGNEELVASDETGFLVPVNDDQALALALSAMMNDRERSHQMGLAGRKRAVEEYSWVGVAEKYLDYLKKVRKNCAFGQDRGSNVDRIRK